MVSTIQTIALSLLAINLAWSDAPVRQRPCQQIDLIELNHCYDGRYRKQFDQVIGYVWSHQHRRFDVVWWYIPDTSDEYPSVVGRGARAKDRASKTGFVSRLYRETWTDHDPEVRQRELFPPHERPCYP